jgi:membrane-bound lytic murein transglycosylase D
MLMKFLTIFSILILVISTTAVGQEESVLPDTLDNGLLRYDSNFDFFGEEETYDLIEDRLSCIENEIPLNFNTRVYSFINYFAIRNRDYTRNVIQRKNMFFPIFEEMLGKYGLPEELKYLSIVESGLVERSISRAGAGGLWQFMPYTGRSYGLHQDFYIDERFDPIKSTEAACKYLKMLHNMFGDWELALAAYNSGPGNVRKAIRRSGYKKSFWEIYRYLPRETRSYLPQFVAITYIMNYDLEHNLLVEDYRYPVVYDTLMINNFLNLKLLAEEINVCYEDLDKLNPSIKRFALPDATKPYPIKIPIDKIEELRAQREEILLASSLSGQKELESLSKNTPGSTYGRERVVYKVRSGDVLGTIAQRYRVRVSDIRKWNNINGNLIRVGQRLNIWVLPGNTVPRVASRSIVPSTPPEVIQKISSGQVYYVQPGDTLWDISRKYEGLSVEKLKELNKLTSNRIQPGQKLIIGL